MEIMQKIEDESIDMILCDPPYGLTNIKWDIALDMPALFSIYDRIIKPSGAVVITAVQPFATDVIQAWRKYFRYDLIWEKTQVVGFLNANKAPLRKHELILVFYKRLPTYNPQKTKASKPNIGRKRFASKYRTFEGYNNFAKPDWEWIDTGERYPASVISISNWNGALFGDRKRVIKHPTSKPVPLFEWLIKTYTNPGDVVLDNCLGAGATAIAARNCGRDFIGIEKKQEYCDLAKKRLLDVPAENSPAAFDAPPQPSLL